MTKRVYRYFFDYTEGQQKWLNDMAARGWRLVKCGQLSYAFERCEPSEYEYAVDFVAEKSYRASKDYKAFLENMGYNTFYKNIAVGIFIGSVKWRPWGEGRGQITTAPGSYQKELLIVEKKRDGKPFELHTDLSDALAKQKKILTSYLWSAIGMFMLAIMCLAFTIWQFSAGTMISAAFCALGAIPCAALGVLWFLPAIRLVPKIRTLIEKSETDEYIVSRNSVSKMVAVIATPFLILGIVFGTLILFDVPFDSYSARGMIQSSWGNHWNSSYIYLSGYKQRRISLVEGTYTFSVDITTKSGQLSLSITGQDGKEYYKNAELSTGVFEIEVDIVGRDKLTLRFDAKNHSGSYKITWN